MIKKTITHCTYIILRRHDDDSEILTGPSSEIPTNKHIVSKELAYVRVKAYPLNQEVIEHTNAQNGHDELCFVVVPGVGEGDSKLFIWEAIDQTDKSVVADIRIACRNTGPLLMIYVACW